MAKVVCPTPGSQVTLMDSPHTDVWACMCPYIFNPPMLWPNAVPCDKCPGKPPEPQHSFPKEG